MPKRSRYEYVRFINNEVQIYASGNTHTFISIKNWKSYESTSNINPEDTIYLLNVFCSSGDSMITCEDEKELQAIVEELREQGI